MIELLANIDVDDLEKAIEFGDVEAAVRNAQGAGATLDGVVETEVWGHVAKMSDPFGNGFCLLQFIRPRVR